MFTCCLKYKVMSYFTLQDMENEILGGVLKEVTTALGGIVYHEIAKVVGVKHEIEKLEDSIKVITRKLNKAVDHAIITHEEDDDDVDVERLKKLKEVAYEAENIIDRFKIEMGTPQKLQVTFFFDLKELL